MSQYCSVELPFLSFNITGAVSEELPERFNKVVATTQSERAVSSLQPDNTEDFILGDIYIMNPREWIFHNSRKNIKLLVRGSSVSEKQVTIFPVDYAIFFIVADTDFHKTLLSKQTSVQITFVCK